MNVTPNRNPSGAGGCSGGPRRRTTLNRVNSSSASAASPGRANNSNGARNSAHCVSVGTHGPRTSNTTGDAARSSSALSWP